MNRFTRLKIYWTVLHLQDDIIAELTIERHEFIVSLVCTVGTIGCIDESTPHNNTTIRFECICQHVGTIDMGASEILWAWFTLTIGLDEESSEVRDGIIDFLYFVPPPTDYIWVKRVGCRDIAQCPGRRKVDRKIYFDTIRSKNTGNSPDLIKTLRGQHLRTGIHIVENGTVDTD